MRVMHKKVFFALSPACLCFALVIVTCLSFLPAYASGELDVSFGTNGLVSTDFGSGWDEGNSVVIDGKDRIVVAGYTYNGADCDFALARYTASGDLDINFGSSGLVSTDFGNDDDAGYSVAIDGEGRIVVAGDTSNGSDKNFALACYDASGVLDDGFGMGGLVSTDFGSDWDEGYSVAIDGEGRIVVAGDTSNGSDKNFALACYDASGVLDDGFGMGGLVSTDFGSDWDEGNSVAIDGKGRIVVAGCAGDDFALARYTTSGDLDTAFSGDGLVSTDFGSRSDVGISVAIDGEGRIVVAGCASGDFALARYTASGDLDTDFGSGGLVSTDFGNGDDWGNSVAIDGKGRIVVAGFVLNSAGYDFALARYIGTDEDTGDAASGRGCSVTTLPGIVVLLLLPLAVLYRKIK